MGIKNTKKTNKSCGYYFLFLGIVFLAGVGCGSSSSPLPNFDEPVLIGNSQENSLGRSITHDASGNTYLGINSTAKLISSSSSPYFVGYVQKYSGSTLLWTQRFSASNGDFKIKHIAASPEGGLFVVGYSNGDIGSFSHLDKQDAFVIKLDSDGNQLWAKMILGSAPDLQNGEVMAMSAVADTNLVYVLGHTTVGTTLGGQSTSQIGSRDFWIALLNQEDGSVNTLIQKGKAATITAGIGIALDTNGKILVGGSTNADLFESKSGSFDYFLASLDHSGAVRWGKQYGAENARVVVEGMTYDPAGALIYITGYTTAPLANGNFFAGSRDLFLSQLNASNGELLWVKQSGATEGRSEGTSLTTDSSGNTYVGGYTSQQIPNAAQVASGLADAILMKFNNKGQMIYSKQFGNAALGAALVIWGLDYNGSQLKMVGESNFTSLSGSVFFNTSFGVFYH